MATCAIATIAHADSIATDRPGNANAATVVPKGKFQFESSINYAHSADEMSFPLLVRLGVLPRLELRASTAIVSINIDNGDLDATTTGLGAKFSIADTDSFAALAMVDIAFPTGSGSTVVPDARLSAGWSFDMGAWVLLNAGILAPADGADGHHIQGTAIANVGTTLPFLSKRASVFIEWYSLVGLSEGAPDTIQFDWGGAWLLSDNWQLDVFAQHGLNDNATDFQLGLGLSARFP